MSGKNGKKQGRPTDYTEEKAEKILDRISDGETLVSICKNEEMPHRTTVNRWANSDDHEEFGKQLEFARETGGDALAEKAMVLADELARSGNTELSRDQILAKIGAIKAYQWQASKLNPKRYGDQVSNDVRCHNGNVQYPIQGERS